MASYQYVYVMKDLTKNFPGGREVFKGITLSFLPGVKIGVLGVVTGESLVEPAKAGVAFAANTKHKGPEQTGILDPAQP